MVHTSQANYSGLPANSIQSGYVYDQGDSLLPLLPLDFAVTLDSAMAKIYEQIRGNSNTVVDLAESGATLKMLRNALGVKKQLKKFFTEIVRDKKFNRLSKGQRRLDYASEKWLEYRYGWMPLISSTYEAIRQLGTKVDGGLVTVSARSSRAISDEVLVSGNGSYLNPRIGYNAYLRFRTELCIQFKLPAGHQIYDWTSLNPIGIAWELAPLSFVADWFVNVGDMLSAWENHVVFANKFVRGYRTDSFREDAHHFVQGSTAYQVEYWPGTTTPLDGPVFNSITKSADVTRLHKNRQVLLTLPSPESGLRLKFELNSKRMLDTCGLIHQFTREFFRKH